MKRILICLLFFSSCVSNNSRGQQQEEEVSKPELPYLISLEREIDNIKPTGLSEVGSTIIYIPLETTSRSFLKELRTVIVTDLFIVVSDVDKILMFDSSGHFIRQFGRRGQGPGEYKGLSITDYCFSWDGSKFYLLTSLRECLEFNVEGKWLNSYQLDSMPNQMLPLKEDLFVFHCLNTPEYLNPIGQSLILSDLNNNIQKTYKNHHKRIKQPGVTVSGDPFYYHQGNMRFKEFGVDTLYTITEEELIPHAIFYLGKKEIPADLHTPNLEMDKALRNYEGCFWMRQILEDVDNFYITMKDDRNKLYGLYNKHTHTAKVIGEQGFQNDIDGGLPFFPQYIYNDSIMVDYVNAFDLREHILGGNAAEMKKQYGKNYDDLVRLVNSLEEDANPIVILVKK